MSNEKLIKIGDFANLFNVSVKAIRYYEEIGVLIPGYVDIYSGYRYYNLENVITMQNIIALKNLGFSLEEIKTIKNVNIEDKIKDYQNQIQDLKDKINNLKHFSLQKGRNDLEMIFINDERVIGKWGLLGVAQDIESAKEEKFLEDDYKIQEIYLLPKGELYWVISWTKNTIYINGRPNHYELINDKLYLTIMDPLDMKNSKVAVYYNIDNKAYRIEDIKTKDNTNVPYVADGRLVGLWKTVDFINNPYSFNPEKIQSSKDMLSLSTLDFKDDGVVRVVYKGGKSFDTKYTKDYIIDLILKDTLSKYTYQELLGEKYIIVEWKSGDYVFGKVINGYYVLEKQERE